MTNMNRTCLVVLAGLICMTIFSIAVLCWVPPVSRDALTHHLAVPKLWIANHGMLELPHLPFSYYPMNLDLLYIIPLIFHNDILPKYIHFLFGLMTAYLIFRYLKPRLNTIYALTGALFFLSTPIIIKLATTAYVDLGLIFFTFSGIMFFFKWMKAEFRVKYIIYCGILCGLAVGTKYQGLIVLLLLTPAIILAYIRAMPQNGSNQVRALAFSGVFILCALLTFAPWMLRNTVWTGNPVHPLFKSLLSESRPSQPDGPNLNEGSLTEPGVTPPKGKKWGHFNVRRYIYQESGWETLTTPIRIFFMGKDNDPRYFDGKLNPFLLLLPLLGFLGFHKDGTSLQKEKLFLAFFSFLYVMIVYFQADMRIRYVTPILPPMVILSMFGLFNLKRTLQSGFPIHNRWVQGVILSLVLGIMFFLNSVYLIHQFAVVNPFPYITGRVDRTTYITQHRPEFAVIDHANTHLPSNSRILAVFLGRRGYYSDREMIFDFSFMTKFVKVSDNPDQLYREFIKRDITHVLFRYDLFNQWVNSNALRDSERTVIKLFLDNYTEPVYAELGHGLYRLIKAPGHQP
jgi:4-amino-4-deoxy-L-arabinose transferase-like glycosyltransferase